MKEGFELGFLTMVQNNIALSNSFLVLSLVLILFCIFPSEVKLAQSQVQSFIKVDKTQYFVDVGHPAQVTITGKIADASNGKVILTITKPDGTSEENTAFVTNRGDFRSLVLLDKNSQLGQYQISASYNGVYVSSTSFTVTNQESSNYSNYSLLKGEWVKYKMYLKTQSNDNSIQQQVQDAMSQQFSGFAGEQAKSIDDIDWMKSTVISVSTDKITTHGEAQVLGKHVDIGDSELKQSSFDAIPTNTKVGDTFDSPLSTSDNPSKVTVTDIKTEKLLGNNIDVYELTSSETTSGNMTTQMDQTMHYDTKTGILLEWVLKMKIYNSTKFVNVEFGMVPIEWSQLPGATAQAPSYSIPSWIKNTAKWWSQNAVTDDDFVKGIQYMIQQGVIVVPTTQVSSQSSHTIPSWVKNTAKWWSDGQVGDSDFVQGIQYLVQNGIIVTQNNNGGNISGLLDGATFYTGTPSKPEMVTYSEDGVTLSVLAIPSEVLLYAKQDTNWNDVNQAITGYGGIILSKMPVMGYYEVHVNNVSKFISDIQQKSFVIYAGPNFVLSPDQTSPNLANVMDLSNYKTGADINAGAKNPDPSAKVIIAVIDNFNGCYVLQKSSHGCHVLNEIQTKTPNLPIMAIQYDGTSDSVLKKDVAAAIETAQSHNQKIVINLSWGVGLKDDDGNVIPNAQEKYAKFIKSTLNMLNNKYTDDGNVVFVKSGGNDNVDVSKAIDQIKSDKNVGERFGKMYLLSGQLDEDTQKPMEYANNRGSNHGSGILYGGATSDACPTGTSCTAPNIVAATAAIWNAKPELKSWDMKNGIINSSTKKGNYSVLSPQDALNSITKCLPSCPQVSYNTGKSSNSSTTTSGSGQQSTTNTQTTNGNQPAVRYKTSEDYCQGTYGSKYHYDSSTNKCVSYGGYDSKEAYCQGTYGSDYHYDSSQDLCVQSSGGGTSDGSGQGGTSGTGLSGTWEGTAKGSAVFYDNSGQLTCQFTGNVSLHLTQSGNSLTGDAEMSGISLAGDGCQAYGLTSVGGQLSSTIFGSGFSGTVDFLTVNGQFTSDLMRGTYSGNGGEYSISGDFTASRAR